MRMRTCGLTTAVRRICCAAAELLYQPDYGTETIRTLDYVENMGLARKVHTATVHMKHAFRVFA
jgi:hypothetical protein